MVPPLEYFLSLQAVPCLGREKHTRTVRVNFPHTWAKTAFLGTTTLIQCCAGETMLNKDYVEWYYVNNSLPQ